MTTKLKSRLTGLIIAAIIVFFDQWSKIYILNMPELSNHNALEITSFFNLALTFNRGVSFGMFAGHNQPLILTAISLIIISILFIWMWRNSSMMLSIAIGSVIGGALGNIIDRIRYGAVVDFLDFHAMGLHFATFNIADSFVFIGVVVLCVYSMFFEKKN
jgi:signal peptidase II